MPERWFRLDSGDRLQVQPLRDAIYLSLLEAPISRDVHRLVRLSREEAAGLVRVLNRLLEAHD